MAIISTTIWNYLGVQDNGKLCAGGRSQSLLPAGGGMSIWPSPFLWLTIPDLCWPGGHRLTSKVAFGQRGIGMPNFWERLTLRQNLC